MNTDQQKSACRVTSITSARLARAPQSHSALALIRDQRAMNLAELARSIHADRNLCYLVTESACQEFGWPSLSVEDAVVLLGRERLCTLLANQSPTSPNWRGRSARQLRRVLHSNETNLRRLESFQGETE